MPRQILAEAQIHPAVRDAIAALHLDVIKQVQHAIQHHPVVVVGMAFNPFVPKARKALDAADVAHHDIDFGGYLSQWRRRNALKMWTGWPTFPMIFVRGQFIGGCTNLQRLIDSGELKHLLTA
jgi:glutaredoxin-related protein